MGKQLDALTPELRQFITQQQMYFVATAGAEGRVNVSPKGMDSLRIIDDHTVRWLNVTGSGNETAAHVKENGRMTVMFCAFEGKPLILRLYGMAPLPGARQIFELSIDLVQTSCGMGVPLYDFRQQRDQLNQWAEKKGAEAVRQYWQEKNRISLDGKATDI